MNKLIDQEPLYIEETDTPINGVVEFCVINENGEIKKVSHEDGEWLEYRKNGQLRYEINYKDGERIKTITP